MKNKKYKWNYKKCIYNIYNLFLYTFTILFYIYFIYKVIEKIVIY